MVWGEAVGFGKGTSSIDNIFSLHKIIENSRVLRNSVL